MKKYLFLAILICLAVGTLPAQTAQPSPKTLIAKLGILNGKATSLPKPAYPAAAAKANASGAVTVNVTVDEEGDVIEATSDFENALLRNAAIAAAQQAKFAPYMFQGKARKVTGTLVYNFVAPKDDLFDMSGVNDFLKTYRSTNAFSGIMDVPGQIEDGKYNDAINILDALIGENAKDEWALGYRALAYYYKNDLARALADANAALAVKPENTRALNVRAMVERSRDQTALANRDFDSAIAISTRAITARPGSMDDYYYRAQTYRLRGENEKAAADYRKTLQLTPGYTYAQKHLDEVTAKQPASVATKLTLNSDKEAKATQTSDVVKKFKEHFEEFTRLDPLFETAAGKVDNIEAAIEADNAKNGRTKFAKPADNTTICKSLGDLDRLYDDLFSEYYDMNEMKENDELVDYPDLIKFVDKAEERLNGLGGDILTKQLLWGCKQPVVTLVK
jgi:TonB family protein